MKNSLSLSFIALAVAGCATDIPKNMPLIFGESITVGIGIGATAADQGASVTVGFKSHDVAIIPVVAYDKDGNPVHLHATVTETTGDKAAAQAQKSKNKAAGDPGSTTTNTDSYSVLGQFSTTADGSGRRVGLGKFFATGTAAQQLSAGFAECLKKDTCGTPQTETKAQPEAKN